MANLRFSPGLLSSIRDFGSSLTEAPASRANTLTGAGVQPASLGGMLARNVGTMLGRDMRTSAEKLQEQLAGVSKNDPNRLRTMIEMQRDSAIAAGDRVNAAKYTQMLAALKERELITQASAKPKAGLSSSELFVQEVKQEDGSIKKYFYRSTPVAVGDVVEDKMTPVGGHDREYDPAGSLSSVGGQYLETAAEDTRREIRETQGKEEVIGWEKTQVDFRTEISSVRQSLKGVQSMIEVLEQIDTGGASAEVYQSVAEFFNIRSPQALGAAKLKKLAQKQVLDQLRATVGGNPSDGERTALLKIMADIETAKEVNLDSLLRTQEALLNAEARLSYGLSVDDPDLYDEYIIAGGAYDSLFEPVGISFSSDTDVKDADQKSIVGGRTGRNKQRQQSNQLPSPDEVDSQYF